MTDPEFRFAPGPDIPDFLIGKTSTEAAALTADLYARVQRQPQAAPEPPAPAVPPSVEALYQASREQERQRPYSETRAYLDHIRDTEFAPVVQQQQAMLAQTNRTVAEVRDPDAFKRWGAEIDRELQKFPPNTWSPDNIKIVADMVRGRHADELAAERAEQLYAQRVAAGERANAFMRPDATPFAGGGFTPARVSPRDNLPAQYKAVLDRQHIDDNVLDEFLNKTIVAHEGISLDAARARWSKNAKVGDILSADGKELVSPVFIDTGVRPAR